MRDPASRGWDGRRPLLPESPRLLFRAWTGADFPHARRLWGDPRVMRYLRPDPLTDDEVRQRLAREATNLDRLGFQYWPLFLADTGAFAGCCGLKPCPYEGSPEVPELEMGFHLVPEVWGRGLATEAGRAVAALAFDRLGAARLYAGHQPENDASRAVLLKLGFDFVRDVFYPDTARMHPLYVLERDRLAR